MTELNMARLCKRLLLNPAPGVNVIVELENNAEVDGDGKLYQIPPCYEGKIYIYTYDVAEPSGKDCSEEIVFHSSEMKTDHVVLLKQKKLRRPKEGSKAQKIQDELKRFSDGCKKQMIDRYTGEPVRGQY